MEKVIYDNGTTKLTAKIVGNTIGLKQFYAGSQVNELSLDISDLKKLNSFVEENLKNK